MRRLFTLSVAGLALAVGGCAAGQLPDLESVSTTTLAGLASQTETTLADETTTTEPLTVPESLAQFATMPLTIEDGEITYVLTVAVALNALERRQGLMGVADLGDLDGMIFMWEEPTTGTFWMKGTSIPLDIAFFAEDGTLVDNFTMSPCTEDPCDNYPARGPYTYAIEVPEPGFAALTPAAMLNLGP